MSNPVFTGGRSDRSNYNDARMTWNNRNNEARVNNELFHVILKVNSIEPFRRMQAMEGFIIHNIIPTPGGRAKSQEWIVTATMSREYLNASYRLPFVISIEPGRPVGPTGDTG